MLCSVLLVALGATLCTAYQQTLTVKGQLFCGSKSATPQDSWVKLLNKRVGFDDQKEVAVNSDGTFQVTLSVDRTFALTPELHIYTDCNDQILGVQKGCQREIKVSVPSSYIGSSSTAAQPYDLGRYNMESKFSDEDRDCSGRRSFGGGAQSIYLNIGCWIAIFIAVVMKNI